MVQIDRSAGKITISVDGTGSELILMQQAILELVKGYNYRENAEQASSAVYFALTLLDSMTLDENQQEKGLLFDRDYLHIPKNVSTKQREMIHESFVTIKTGKAPRNTKNPVLEALLTVGA